MLESEFCTRHENIEKAVEKSTEHIERLLEAIIGTEEHPGFAERMRTLEWQAKIARWFIGSVLLALTVTAVGSIAQLVLSTRGQATNTKELIAVTEALKDVVLGQQQAAQKLLTTTPLAPASPVAPQP
jgi:hypothetical protein